MDVNLANNFHCGWRLAWDRKRMTRIIGTILCAILIVDDILQPVKTAAQKMSDLLQRNEKQMLQNKMSVSCKTNFMS